MPGPKATSQAKLQKLVQLRIFRGSQPAGLFTFLINPESYQQSELARAQVYQTLGGGFADLWGPALVQIQFSGTTGLQEIYVNGMRTDGYERFHDLLGTIRAMWRDPVLYKAQDWHMFLYNWTDDQFFEVLPLQNTWTQAVPEPLIFRYQLSFIALRSLSTPSAIQPYAIRQWFTADISPALVQAATNGAMALARTEALLLRDSALTVVPAWTVAQLMEELQAQSAAEALAQAWYGLSPRLLPLEAFYPGVSAIGLDMRNLGEGTLFPLFTTIHDGGPLPYPVNYADIVQAWQQAETLLKRLEALNAVPNLLDAAWGDVTDALAGLSLFPEGFLPAT